MATKPLLINSTQGNSIDSSDSWVEMKSLDGFINSIVTSDGSENASSEQFNTLVSGVPSPWARIKLTKYALTSDLTDKDDKRILIECYRHMRSEWRGLMASYILFSDRFIASSPVPMSGKKITETYGRFDARNILGDMLFNDGTLWKYTSDTGKNEDAAPKIQLLYYKDPDSPDLTLAGATSPYTIFFPSTNYSMSNAVSTSQKREEMFWIDDEGKFADPASERFRKHFDDVRTKKDFKKIVQFLRDIKECLPAYQESLLSIGGNDIIDSMKDIGNTITTMAEDWIKDITKIYSEAELNNIPVSINTAAKPSGPLAQLLNKKYTYWWGDNQFSATEKEGKQYLRIDNVQDLFVDSKYLVAFKSTPEECEKYENAPVIYLKAEDNGNIYFTALPFSRFAIDKCFKNETYNIVNGNANVKVSAKVNSNMIKITLTAKISDNEVDIASKEYSIYEPDSPAHIITWPNFASSLWNKYYYYSEYPINGSGIKAFPIFKGFGVDDDNSAPILDFTLKDEATQSELEKRYLVSYPVGKVDSSAHRYEIIRSEYPIYLVQLGIDRDEQEYTAGFLMLKKGDNGGMKEKITTVDSLANATVGIDFGSTNTCAYYRSDKDEKTIPMPFSNRRLSLLGFDNPARSLAQKNELLFISNEETINNNGQVKSWLHSHNSQYIASAKKENELIGGVPVNETNIAVKEISENFIKTNAGELYSNMKWLSDTKGNELKKSFMNTLWVMICADLFDADLKPENLFWSYPSAMSGNDRKSMSKIFNDLRDTPIDGVRLRKIKSHTESEAVCSYAITKKVSLQDNRLFVGIDIGGSTSDILILGNGNGNGSGNKTLLSQCSIRIAANHFFKAVNSSAKFRKALYKFHESKATKVKVINIEDIISNDKAVYSRAPYYLNNIFDQLNGGDEFRKFYNSLNQDVPSAFCLPCYITGILVFYAGLLTRKAISTNELQNDIDEIHMRYYGKGGRTFEWIYGVYEDDAKRFYAKCFKAGLGNDGIKFFCDNAQDILSEDMLENKSEVAIGLVNLKPDIDGIYNAPEDNGDDSSVTDDPKQFLSEVFGEKGFYYTDSDGNKTEIDELDIVDGAFIKKLHCPREFENFSKFISLYTNFLEETGVIRDTQDIQTLRDEKKSIENVKQFFDNDKEYAKYLESRNTEHPSTYRMPLFIAEALYYLDKVLLPEVFKD